MAVAPLSIVPVPCACGRELCGPDRPALRILCDMVDRYDASETRRRVVVRGRHGFLFRNHARKLPAHSTIRRSLAHSSSSAALKIDAGEVRRWCGKRFERSMIPTQFYSALRHRLHLDHVDAMWMHDVTSLRQLSGTSNAPLTLRFGWSQVGTISRCNNRFDAVVCN